MPVSTIVSAGPTFPSTIAGRDRGDDPGQADLVGEDVAAVGEHDRDRQLDEVVVGTRRMTRAATKPVTRPIAMLMTTVPAKDATASAGPIGA